MQRGWRSITRAARPAHNSHSAALIGETMGAPDRRDVDRLDSYYYVRRRWSRETVAEVVLRCVRANLYGTTSPALEFR